MRRTFEVTAAMLRDAAFVPMCAAVGIVDMLEHANEELRRKQFEAALVENMKQVTHLRHTPCECRKKGPYHTFLSHFYDGTPGYSQLERERLMQLAGWVDESGHQKP